MRNQVDTNDLAHIIRLGYKPLFGIPCPQNKDTGKINPNATEFYLENGDICRVFHVKPVYYETVHGNWRPLSEVTTFHGNHRISLIPNWAEKMSFRYFLWLTKRQALFPDFKGGVSIDYGVNAFGAQPRHMAFATTTTAYPDPDTETTTVDGRVHRESVVESWATIRAGAGNASNDSGPTIIAQSDASASPNWRGLLRMVFLFDTSAIPDSETISAATISLFGSAVDSSPDEAFVIVGTAPASNTALANSDFNASSSNFHTDAFSSTILASALSASAYNDFTLNATGIAAVSKTGVTKMGCILEDDRTGTEISHPGSEQQATDFRALSADTALTTSDPKIVVTSAASTAIKTWNGLADASTKVYNGLARASVKTFNGLA